MSGFEDRLKKLRRQRFKEKLKIYISNLLSHFI